MSYPSLPAKKPVEILDYQFDWTKRLVANDHIVTSSWTLSSNSTSAIAANSHANTTSTVWLSGGTANTTNVIFNIVTTADGRTMEAAAQVKVQAP